ncbi:response regulator transcription factor [Clostridium sp. BJN0001]|uniref:response regulator transcription factor n=1 Tax=Clostridium sp. BJN0001 TaxID=2930219 RepID=UPI001FD38F8F|nr:response regulator transcription factor [Clostridium sp. BJN0001]
MDIKILIAEDDRIIRELVCDIMKSEGYIPIEAGDGVKALDIFFSRNDIDIVILDVMMPGYDGWEVLKEIRQKSDVPIVMLTALGDEKHEVFGFNKGADEYIAKPFSYEVFIARINNIAKKIKKKLSEKICLENIIVDNGSHKVMIKKNDLWLEVKLNNKEYSLLIYFIENQNNVLNRDQILDKIWGFDFDGDIRTIDTHIKTLRSKLEDCGHYIKTVRGTGYIFQTDKNEDSNN